MADTDRQIQRITETLVGISGWVGNSVLQLANCWRLSVDKPGTKNSRGTKSLGGPQFCEFYLQELYQILTMNREKNPFVFL